MDHTRLPLPPIFYMVWLHTNTLELKPFKSRVKDCVISKNSNFVISVGDNNYAKLYNVNDSKNALNQGQIPESNETYITSSSISSIDLNYKNDKFVTSGETVELWDINKIKPIEKFDWGCDTII